MKKVCAGAAAVITAAVVGAGVLTSVPATPSVAAELSANGARAEGVHAAPAAAEGVSRSAGRTSYTLLLGDSIAHQSRSELKELRPHWIVDAVDGRNVDRLLPLLQDWIDRKGQAPDQLVVELGTNWSRTWDGADYRKVERLVPDAEVVYVTPYRALTARHPRSDARYPFARTGESATWMRRLAERSGVCVAEWRDLVEAHPALLRDGVHPTVPARRTWARLVSDASDTCRSEAGHS
jgi:hypothetical protein